MAIMAMASKAPSGAPRHSISSIIIGTVVFTVLLTFSSLHLFGSYASKNASTSEVHLRVGEKHVIAANTEDSTQLTNNPPPHSSDSSEEGKTNAKENKKKSGEKGAVRQRKGGKHNRFLH